MEQQQEKRNNNSWQTILKTGQMGFSKAAERRFFFYMTLVMLLAGIVSKIISTLS